MPDWAGGTQVKSETWGARDLALLRGLMQDRLLNLLAGRRGHFLLESGHHGELWLDLEVLYRQPHLVQPFTRELAGRLSQWDVEAVCGPLVEGAFVALKVAEEQQLEFCYAERSIGESEDELFPAAYRLPEALRESVRGKRVAIVHDVINAGSAVRGAYADLKKCGATVVGIGALLVLGDAACRFAAQETLAFTTLATLPNLLWTPADCPLCASGLVLDDPGNFSRTRSDLSIRAAPQTV